MIAKLRKKFIITALLAVFALLTSILVVINFVNFSIVSDEADSIIQRIVTEGGVFGDNFRPDNNMEMNGQRPIGPNSPELGKTTRYFTVNFDVDNNPTNVDLRMSAVNQAEAIEWARGLLGTKQGWTRTYYRYLVWRNDAGTHVTVIDYNRELSPSYRVLLASIIGEAVGLSVTFIVLLGVSNAFVKPIEQSDRRQKRFIRDAAYEIKNPITVIDANRHLLEERLGTAEETTAIDAEVKRLTRLVKGLDELLLLENSTKKLQKESVDLSALAREVVGAYQPLFDAAEKHLLTDIETVTPFEGDSLQLGEMFHVCMDNALRYGKTYASFAIKQSGERILITVKNDAEGIDDGPLDSVFERFLRGEAAVAQEADGTGIQLSVAKEIVKRHGGRIMAEGKDGAFILKIEL